MWLERLLSWLEKVNGLQSNSQVRSVEPKELLYQGTVVAELSGYSYSFPWASAHAEFVDKELSDKLAGVTAMLNYDHELESMDLPEAEEETLWKAKLGELGLSTEDCDLDNDEHWSVVSHDGTLDEVRAIRHYTNGLTEWRAS